jgi:hypothetical protein
MITDMGNEGKPIKTSTNLLFIKADKILLGYKKRGFGKGKYNGFGGKPLPGNPSKTPPSGKL